MRKDYIPNSTQIPNDFIDLLNPRLPEAEARCITYICRRTYGFHKKIDRISLSQFTHGITNKDGKRLDFGVGMTNAPVVEALKNLVNSEAIFKIKDTKGNLRKFSQQQFRCVSCNHKFRRPPLKGVCTKCGGKIIFTISYGGIVKYLEPAMALAESYDVPAYTKQSLLLAKKYIESIFGKEKEKQEALEKWF